MASGVDQAANQIAVLHSAATQAAQAGRTNEALAVWAQILQIDPNHVATLTALGKHAMRSGDMKGARAAFERVTKVDGRDQQQWLNLALANRQLHDDAAEEAAITQALTVDPMDLLALIMRAEMYERFGKRHQAASAHAAVANVAPPLDQLHPSLRPAVERAIKFKTEYDRELARFMDDYLQPHLANHRGDDLHRFQDSLDIMVGRKRRYESESMVFHYHGLPPIEFFDNHTFPWVADMEAKTDAIRNEFLAVMREDAGFTPYIKYGKDLPLNQWAELNHSPRWSAFHLLKQGRVVTDNAAKCPITMDALKSVPQPAQEGRTPAAMFSLLKPRTRIPPHVGVSNARLVVHLPLVVPAGCGFRVGNTVREWEVGKIWVFDDTIQHEAWNDSDELRVVFIFDTWHPALSEAERDMVSALSKGLNAFNGFEPDFPL
jgi:aspartate beta-hydroxylase